MATPYEKIYNRFLQKISDFNLAEVDDYSFDEMMNSWLNSAVIRVRKCQHDLSKRDDEIQEFEENLSDLEVELLACGMVDSWLAPQLASTELTLMMLGGKEEKLWQNICSRFAMLGNFIVYLSELLETPQSRSATTWVVKPNVNA